MFVLIVLFGAKLEDKSKKRADIMWTNGKR